MKAIIFDCDGTLVDSEIFHFQAWVQALKNQNCHFTLNDYYDCVGIPLNLTAAALAQKFGCICPDKLQHEKHEFFQLSIEKGVPPITDTFAFLQKLIAEQKRCGYKLAIASGAPKNEILHYLRHLKVEEAFDVILSGKDDLNHYSDPEGVNKPKPYIYLEAAKRLGVPPAECAAIEDSYTGLMAGYQAGCVTVAIPNTFTMNHDFSISHLQIPSLQTYSVDQFLAALKNVSKSKFF